ncbi:MAG TPA: type II secretion system minor pseudopilin GspK, partial [Steroidobacteraceae bacterium]|nr:type II secretion system minor pseudopilin GspK [Steroidobacteraceae bacterium]
AMLVAILLVALGTILAAAVAYENAMTARRGTATYAFDQSILIAQGAEALAAYGLRQIRQSDPQHIYPGQGWDKPLGPVEVVPGVMLEASLEDLQGRLNLNNLVGPDGTPNTPYVNAFATLLETLGLEPKWAGFVVDWIDYDLVPQNPDGAEDSVYMGQVPPYRTANRYITSPSELLALPGFGPDRYQKLAPYVTALPYATKINVCTAPGLVLDAFIGAGHSEFGANPQQLTQNRGNTTGCFPTLANFVALLGPQASGNPGPNVAPNIAPNVAPNVAPNARQNVAQYFGQNSNYFRLTSFITIGSTEFNLYSLLYQDTNGMVRPIQRSFTPD